MNADQPEQSAPSSHQPSHQPSHQSSVPSSDRSALSKTAYDHLWMHFTRMSSYENAPVPTIVRGEGTYIYDDHGKRYIDGLSGLFVVNAGHGRHEL
ncbi:MAG: hypothetical protein QOF98_877, partial [Streptomyces sp.]|nr:hypothetical protein [Streptomyces sp.]